MIGFLGLGHLGQVVSACWRAKGLDVCHLVASDSAARADAVRREPGLGVLPYPSFGDTAQCDIIMVTLDVPTDPDGTSHPEAVRALLDSTEIPKGVPLVIMSQVPPGFCRSLTHRLAWPVVYMLDTLVIGDAVEAVMHPARIVLGTDGGPVPTVLTEALMRFRCPILTMSYEAAELAKSAINVWLAASVAQANLFAQLAAGFGADYSAVKTAMHTDPRIGWGAYLNAGLPLSGGHIERELVKTAAMAGPKAAEWLRLIPEICRG